MAIQFTFCQEGDILDYTNTGSVTLNPGDPVPMVNAFGVVAGNAIPVGGTGAVTVHGVFIAASDPAVSFAAGDKLYWDATNKFITNNATETGYAGYAAQAKAASVSMAYLKLNY